MTKIVTDWMRQIISEHDIECHVLLRKITSSLATVSSEQAIPEFILSDLKKAIVLGSSDALFLLADFITASRVLLHESEQLHYLEMAAKRNHRDAAFFVGCMYGGLMQEEMPASLLNVQKALDYLMQAVELSHPHASYALLCGMLDKDPPHLSTNAAQFESICKELIHKGDKTAALFYGRALSGYEPKEFKPRFHLETNKPLGLKYLLTALHGSNQLIERQAHSLIQRGAQDKSWTSPFVNTVISPSFTQYNC